MTLIRRLALKVSGAVVRYASPGCKEWVEGLAREVDFVESDWSALAWAFSSVRVLFDYREAPVRSLDDLPAAALKFVESRRGVSVVWAVMFLQSLVGIDKFFQAANWSEHFGCSLVVFSSTSLGIITFIERRRLKVPQRDDIAALVQFYKAELERLCNLHSFPWMTVSAVTFLCLGEPLAQRGGIHEHPGWAVAWVLFWVVMVLLTLQTWRINRRRLERLDALLADSL
ncbi:MAG TPA: hypothetical protein VGG18_15775 [Granulicella sp.]|jgi:hypothetical protein